MLDQKTPPQPDIPTGIQVLWGDRKLNLVWIDDDCNLHTPCLLNSQPNSYLPTAPEPGWYYRVDIAYAAWLTRVKNKAEAAGDRPTERDLDIFNRVRGYLEELQPGCSAEIDKRASRPESSPFPTSDILVTAAYLTHYNLSPKWQNYEKYLPANTPTTDTPTNITKAMNKRRLSNDDRS